MDIVILFCVLILFASLCFGLIQNARVSLSLCHVVCKVILTPNEGRARY